MWRSGDAELFHSAAERVGMKGEDLRRAVGAINDPTRLLKGSQDMIPRVRFQAFERRSLLHASCRRPLVFGTWRPWRISVRRTIGRCGGEHFRIDLKSRTV